MIPKESTLKNMDIREDKLDSLSKIKKIIL